MFVNLSANASTSIHSEPNPQQESTFVLGANTESTITRVSKATQTASGIGESLLITAKTGHF